MDKNRVTIFLKLKPHLKTFILNSYPNISEPVYFPKKDKINHLIAHSLQRTPPGYKPKPPDPTDLEVILPFFDHNCHVFNWLSPNANEIVENWINDQFWVAFIRAMNRDAILGIPINLAINQFLERYNLKLQDNQGRLYLTLRKAVYRRHSLNQLWPKRKYEAN